MLDLRKHPHRRYNPLTREWVLVSPQRTDRPWLGQVEEVQAEALPDYDPQCYLCPGNTRAGGARNPDYENTFVFDNDFAALTPDIPVEKIDRQGLIVTEGESGICRVVCFSPHHNLTLSNMKPAELRSVVDVWIEQYCQLGSLPWISCVQIFENRGALMGASNPHPHGQIWANSSLPNEMVKELTAQVDYRASSRSCLLCDYLRLELERKERVVYENEDFVVVVPFWAVWPFETLLLSHRHFTGLDQIGEGERDNLARMFKDLTSRYDKLFKTCFPYSMGFHQRPTDGQPHNEFHFHGHFYPPLLRSATVRKFMVGYELLAMPQRDITAETAAARLRELGQ